MRILFILIDFNSFPCIELLLIKLCKLSVGGEFIYAEVNVAVCSIGVTVVLKPFNKRKYFVNMICCTRYVVSLLYVQLFFILKKSFRL